MPKEITLVWVETRLNEQERRDGVIEKWLLMEEANIIGEAYSHGPCGHGVLADGFCQIDTENGLKYVKEWLQQIWIDIRRRSNVWISSLIMLSIYC